MNEPLSHRAPQAPIHRDALPQGTRLDEFEIQRTLGVGGFGIVYQAFDHTLHRLVAIKEYLPSALAARGFSRSLEVRQSEQETAYRAGLASFMGEARMLARFDHPSLVKVFRFWEANNTAYMVMPLYQGMTLKQAREKAATPPPEAWLRSLLQEVLGALRVLHQQGVLHRDISPDNIFLQEQGPPVLLDLGAARHAIEGHARQMTAVLKVNYAPIEQYADGNTPLHQGPWSDLYALGAVLHACITQQPPQPSTHRAVHDQLPSFAQLAVTVEREFGIRYSQPLVQALDALMALRPEQRPADGDELLRRLGEGAENERLNLAAARAAWGVGWSRPQAAPAPDLALAQEEDTAFAPTQLPLSVSPQADEADIDWVLGGEPSEPADAAPAGAAPASEYTQIVPSLPSSGEPQVPPEAAGPSAANQVQPPSVKPSAGKRAAAKPQEPASRPQPSKAGSAVWKWGIAAALALIVGGGVWLGMGSNPLRTESVLHVPTVPTEVPPSAGIVAERGEGEIMTEQAGEGVWLEPAGPADAAPTEPAQAAGVAPAFVHSGDARGITRQTPKVTLNPQPPAAPVAPAAGQGVPGGAVPVAAPTPSPAQRGAAGSGLCANEGFFARGACLSRECEKPANAQLPACREWRERTSPMDSVYQN